MNLTPPPAQFVGSIDAYIEQYVVPNVPAMDTMAAWTSALLDYYETPNPLCVVRGRAGSRGAPYTDGTLRVVGGDNSPGRWCTLRAMDGAVSPADLNRRIEDGHIPVLYAASKEEQREWKWGAAMSSTDKATFSSLRLKHCHIDGALDGAPPSPRIRALRNLCPINHFLWPMPKHYSMFREGWHEHPNRKDLGESQVVIARVRARMDALMDGEQRAVHRRFLHTVGGALRQEDGSRRIRMERKQERDRGGSTTRSTPATRRHREASAVGPAAGMPSADELWKMALRPATPVEAALVLARHPNQADLTLQLLEGPVTGRRMVAITNTLYNWCRPPNVRKRGQEPTPEYLWKELLARRDTPHSSRPSKWRPLVAALSPVPDWAAKRVAAMSIEDLGSMAAAVVAGPYKLMMSK